MTSTMKRLLAAAVAAGFSLSAGPVLAHADHGRPAHGGVVAEGGVFQGELVAKPDGAVTLHLSEHGAPIAAQGVNAKLTVLTGGRRVEAVLQPTGADRLEAKVPGLQPGAKAVAAVTLPDRRSATLRFALP